MNRPSVLISILNWNNAAETLNCVSSLARETREASVAAKISIIDNGSSEVDYHYLRDGVRGSDCKITRLDSNLGFTGGHNISIKLALESGFKYIWLLNNDATVDGGCLKKIVDAMEDDDSLGAVSPVILPRGGGDPIAAWGGIHEWKARATVWFLSEIDSSEAHRLRPNDVFVAGTAILLRVDALREVGSLDDRLFAYYDDSDIAVRLAKKGWRSKVVFDATVQHGWRAAEQLPNYFFYLFYRNEMIFLLTHTPPEYRAFLWLKLVNQSIYNAVRLALRGCHSQADAVLLGIWDFALGNYGRPDLNRKVPALMRWACRISSVIHISRLKELKRPTI